MVANKRAEDTPDLLPFTFSPFTAPRGAPYLPTFYRAERRSYLPTFYCAFGATTFNRLTSSRS